MSVRRTRQAVRPLDDRTLSAVFAAGFNDATDIHVAVQGAEFPESDKKPYDPPGPAALGSSDQPN